MGSYKPDKAAWRGRSMTTKKPWGEETSWSALPSIVGKVLSIKEGHRTSLKYNTYKDEVFYVKTGTVEFLHADEEWLHYRNADAVKKQVLNEGDSMVVQSHCIYRLKALSNCEVIEIGNRPDQAPVRLHDDYGREVSEAVFPNPIPE